MTEPARLRRAEAAAYLQERWRLQVGKALLTRFGCTGGGPPYYRVGRVALYERGDLDAWAQQRLGTKATSNREHRQLAAEARA